jgi:hypothetical protein
VSQPRPKRHSGLTPYRCEVPPGTDRPVGAVRVAGPVTDAANPEAPVIAHALGGKTPNTRTVGRGLSGPGFLRIP